MSDDQFAEYLKKMLAEAEQLTAHLPKPIASVFICRDSNSIEVYLDNTKSSYSEWIKGEGADIGLLRDQETNRVVGVRLPLYAKTMIFGDGGGKTTITVDLRKDESVQEGQK